jgi:peptide/nickel transport system substrate-binding protein
MAPPLMTRSAMMRLPMVRSQKPARLLLLLLLAATLLAGCGKRGGEPKNPPPAADAADTADTGTPQRGGTVTASFIAEPGGINEYVTPATLVTDELLFTVFRHLVQEQPDFDKGPPTFAPELARSYDWSPDHKTLTFHLREDALWSDGVPVTAEDVVWTWQVQTDPQVAWDSAHMKNGIARVEAVDPHTVRFLFKSAYAKQMTDANEGAIIPKHAWSKLPFAKWHESADWFKQTAVYSGPFVVASWKPQQEVVLARNPRFYEKDRPYLDRVVMRITADPSAGLLQVLNGEVDFISQIPPGDAAKVQSDPKLRLITYWSNLYVFVAWNSADPLFADRDVRRALTLAIDRKAIVDTILGPYGRVGSSPILSSVWAHDPQLQPLPYDPAGARRILESKGWKDTDGDGVLDRNGKPFAFELTSNAGNRQRADASVMMQEQLRKVGVKATPRVLEFNTLIEQSNRGQLAAVVMGLSLDTSLDLTGNFHSKSIPGPGREGSNYERYVNPELDRLIDRLKLEPDLRQALPEIVQIQRIIDRDQPVTFLWESQRLSPINRRVHNAHPNQLRSFFNLKDWWVEPRP